MAQNMVRGLSHFIFENMELRKGLFEAQYRMFWELVDFPIGKINQFIYFIQNSWLLFIS